MPYGKIQYYAIGIQLVDRRDCPRPLHQQDPQPQGWAGLRLQIQPLTCSMCLRRVAILETEACTVTASDKLE